METQNTPPEAPQGLIHTLLLDGSGGARQLSWSDAIGWAEDQGCLWLHFSYEDSDTRNWIRNHSGLNDIAADGLLSLETRPRTLSRGDNLLIALRGVNLNPDSKPEDMVSLRLWTDGKRVVSTRRRSLLSTEDVLEQLDAGSGPTDAASLLVDLTDRIVWRMSDTVDKFEDEVMALESKALSEHPGELRYELAQLRKQTIGIRRYLAPQREALNRLATEKLSWLDELNQLRLREVADRQIRHIEDIDEVRERAAMAQEELISRISEQMNERTFVLTIVAAIFLPLGFFTGLLGINVGGVPGVEDADAFWVVTGLCVGITLLLALFFRFKNWL